MAYKGQPVPTTTHQVYRAKVGDGKSVRVTVPERTTIEAQKFYEIEGFFGVAGQSVVTKAGETAEVILTIEQAEYETDQIVTTDEFNVGDVVYFDGTNLTTAADDGGEEPTLYRKVGRVTAPKDDKNVIWFILGPQV